MPLPEYRESAARIYVPAFTMYEGHLAVLTTLTDDRHALPNMYVHEHHRDFQATAHEALYTAFGEAQPTLEPTTTHIQARADNTDIEVGYAAITTLVNISSNRSLVPVALPRIEDSTFGLTDVEVDFVKLGLEGLRIHPNMTWNAHLQRPDTLPMLSRLVKNPRRFTVSELRVAFEALLYDSIHPSDRLQAPRKQIDRANFQREVKAALVPLSEHRDSGEKGRPARLYAMPPAILASGLNE